MEKSGSKPLSVAYVGTDSQYQNYLADLIFQKENFTSKNIGRIKLEEISEKLRRDFSETSAVFFEWDSEELSKFLDNKNGFKIPRWVECTMDISKPISELKKDKQIKDFVRQTRKNNYSYRVSKNKNDFENFYHKMYLPYIKNTHQNTAYTLGFNYFKKLCEESVLILLEQDGEDIGGLLLEFRKNSAHMGYFGFKDGNLTFSKQGATSAMYFYAIEVSKERGFSELCFGPSKSFLGDGVLRYKLGKGAKLVDKVFTSDEDLRIEILNLTDGLKDFLLNNPFIFYPKGKVRSSAIFIESEFSEEQIFPTLKKLKVDEGVEEFSFIYFEDENFRKTNNPKVKFVSIGKFLK